MSGIQTHPRSVSVSLCLGYRQSTTLLFIVVILYVEGGGRIGVDIESMWLQSSFLSCGLLKIPELYYNILRLSELNVMFLVQHLLVPIYTFLEGIGMPECIEKICANTITIQKNSS